MGTAKDKKICSITTGKSNTQDQVNDGSYPFYIRSDYPVRSNRYLYDEEAVITIGDGNIGRVFHYVNGKFDNYHRMLQATTKSKSKGTREFINILKLTKSNGIEKIGQLLRELDKINRYSYEEVLSLLRFKEDIKLDKKVPTEILEAMGVSDIKSSSPRISQYNKLLEGGVDIERRVI